MYVIGDRCYLFTYGIKKFPLEIHEMDFIAALFVIVVNSVNNLTIGIIDGATICIAYK